MKIVGIYREGETKYVLREVTQAGAGERISSASSLTKARKKLPEGAEKLSEVTDDRSRPIKLVETWSVSDAQQ